MKHFVPFLKAFVLVAFTFFYGNSTAQVGELSFSNPSLVSGSAGANGAVYRFPNVNATFDALVTIKGRSSSQVNLTSIDLTSTGFQKAFQPQIRWGSGSVSSAQSWWMEFEITFVNKGTSVATLVDELKVTALDIDGDNSRLNEWVAFHNTNMYKLEANSALNVSNLVHSGVVIGKRFDGIVKEHPGIDTAATELMTTLTYENSSTITVRMGAATTGSASNTNRMYSIWFRDFNYQQPLILPVKLLSFNGNSHNQKVTLNWMVDMNEDADSYEVEKSTNGRDFSKVALVFPTNKQGVESYIYNAAAPAQGKELYRLKLVDKNGTISYSRILAFQAAGAATANTLRIAGNPAGGQLNVSYQTNNRQITLRVLNMNGGTLLQQTVATMTGTNLIGVDISSIAGTGLYILEVVDGPVRTSTRFVK